MTTQQILEAVILLMLVGRLGHYLKRLETRRQTPDPGGQA